MTASPKSPTSRAPRKLIFGMQLAFNLTRRNIERKNCILGIIFSPVFYMRIISYALEVGLFGEAIVIVVVPGG